jgi:hypothetical protein
MLRCSNAASPQFQKAIVTLVSQSDVSFMDEHNHMFVEVP